MNLLSPKENILTHFYKYNKSLTDLQRIKQISFLNALKKLFSIYHKKTFHFKRISLRKLRKNLSKLPKKGRKIIIIEFLREIDSFFSRNSSFLRKEAFFIMKFAIMRREIAKHIEKNRNFQGESAKFERFLRGLSKILQLKAKKNEVLRFFHKWNNMNLHYFLCKGVTKINENKEKFIKIRINRVFWVVKRGIEEKQAWALENIRKIASFKCLKEEFQENSEIKYEFFRKFIRKRIENTKKTPINLKRKAFFVMKENVLQELLKRNTLFFYLKNLTFNNKLALKKKFDLFKLKGEISNNNNNTETEVNNNRISLLKIHCFVSFLKKFLILKRNLLVRNAFSLLKLEKYNKFKAKNLGVQNKQKRIISKLFSKAIIKIVSEKVRDAFKTMKIPKINEKMKISIDILNLFVKMKTKEILHSSFLLLFYRSEMHKIQSLPKIQVIIAEEQGNLDNNNDNSENINDDFKNIDKSIIYNQAFVAAALEAKTIFLQNQISQKKSLLKIFHYLQRANENRTSIIETAFKRWKSEISKFISQNRIILMNEISKIEFEKKELISSIDQQYHYQNQIVSKAKAKINTGIKTDHTTPPDRFSMKNLTETKNSLEAIDLEYIFELAKMPKVIEIQYIEYNETLNMELRTQVKEQEERRIRNKEKFLKKKEMLEEMINSLQSEKNSSGVKDKGGNSEYNLRKSLLIVKSQDNGYIQNKSISFFFHTLDEGKIKNYGKKNEFNDLADAGSVSE